MDRLKFHNPIPFLTYNLSSNLLVNKETSLINREFRSYWAPPPFPKRKRERKKQTDTHTERERERERERDRQTDREGEKKVGRRNSIDLLGTKEPPPPEKYVVKMIILCLYLMLIYDENILLCYGVYLIV